MKRFQYFLGAFVFLVLGVLVGWGIPRQAAAPATSQVTLNQSIPHEVSLMVDEGDGTVKVFEHLAFADGQSLFDVTQKIADENHLEFTHDPPGKYGILITAIDGKKNGTSGTYWLYWVNNQAGEVGADQYKVKAGDVIEWKFINMKF